MITNRNVHTLCQSVIVVVAEGVGADSGARRWAKCEWNKKNNLGMAVPNQLLLG